MIFFIDGDIKENSLKLTVHADKTIPLPLYLYIIIDDLIIMHIQKCLV